MTLSARTRAALERHGENARKARKARELRDAAIRRAVANGGTLREVAEAVGLSHVAVAKIANRKDGQ